jgi:predicted TIM-barrel fold metal-dependent hydrolase
MKVIDMHVHLFPEDVEKELLKHYVEISGQSLLACPSTLEGLRNEYREYEVLKFGILGTWESTKKFESKNIRLMAESDIYYDRHYFYSYNGWLAKLQREHKDILCFGNVHHDDPEMKPELEKMFGQYHLAGLKMQPCMMLYTKLNDRRLFPAYEKAQAMKAPLVLHTGGDPQPGREIYGHPRDVDDIATSFPKLTIIMAHMGAPFFGEAQEVVRRHGNVFTDLSFTIDYNESMKLAKRHKMEQVSGISRKDFNALAAALVKGFGFERVVYGSDFPYASPRDAIQGLLELDIPDEAKEMILWKNAKELLGI